MLKNHQNNTVVQATTAVSAFSPAIATDRAYTMSAQCSITVNTPTNPTFLGSNTSLSTGIITATAHGLNQGQLVTLTTTGSLPTGLATSTTYYIILLTANTFQIASSAANALAGTAIVPSGAGTGTNTVVVTALAGGTVCLQKSNDGVLYINEGTPATVTSTGLFFLEKVGCTSMFMRVAYVLTSGSLTSSTVLCVIADLP